MALFPRQEWFDRFTSELGVVIGALTEAKVATVPSEEMPEGGWVVAIEASAGARGMLHVHFDRAGAETVSQQIMGLDAIPPDSAVVDTLKELCAQAIGTVLQHFAASDLILTVAAVAPAGPDRVSSTVLVGIQVGASTMRLAFWGEVELVTGDRPARTESSVNPKLDVILDIDLPLMVRFGRTEMSLKALTALGPGSVIDLGRSPDDPVEVLVSNQVVAHGEVVVVAGNYGVRITDVVSPADRVKTLEFDIR